MGRAVTRGIRNYLAWDEAMNVNPPWNPTNLTVPSIAEASPDGRGVGNTLHEDATVAASHYIEYSPAMDILNQYRYTLGIRAKAENRDWLRLMFVLAGVDAECYFDVANGVVGTASATVDAANIQLIATDWYECWITFLADQTAFANSVRIDVAEADSDITFDGLDQDSLTVFRPQLCEGWGLDPAIYTSEVPLT